MTAVACDCGGMCAEQLANVTRERDAALADVHHMKDREQSIIEACERVADGGRYRADIVSAIDRIRRERDMAELVAASALVEYQGWSLRELEFDARKQSVADALTKSGYVDANGVVTVAGEAMTTRANERTIVPGSPTSGPYKGRPAKRGPAEGVNASMLPVDAFDPGSPGSRFTFPTGGNWFVTVPAGTTMTLPATATMATWKEGDLSDAFGDRASSTDNDIPAEPGEPPSDPLGDRT